MKLPEKTEYAEFYENYVSLAAENDIVASLENQVGELKKIFSEISEENGVFAYAEGKWTIRELLGHIIDGERVFSYRALRFSRDDATPLAGFEENFYVANSNFSVRSLADLVEEFSLLRQSNFIFFKNLSEDAWLRRGVASDNEVSVNALAHIMVGHVRHHLNILRERYLTR